MTEKAKSFYRQTLLTLGEIPNNEKPGKGHGVYIVRWCVDGEVMKPRIGTAQYYTVNGVKALAGMKGLTREDLAVLHKNWNAVTKAMMQLPEFVADKMPLDSSNEAPQELVEAA